MSTGYIQVCNVMYAIRSVHVYPEPIWDTFVSLIGISCGPLKWLTARAFSLYDGVIILDSRGSNGIQVVPVGEPLPPDRLVQSIQPPPERPEVRSVVFKRFSIGFQWFS